jgi:mRNA interferase MazF
MNARRVAMRSPIKFSQALSINVPCRLMVDRITTVPRTRIGHQIGRLDDEDIVRLNRAVLVFLGFAGSAPEN